MSSRRTAALIGAFAAAVAVLLTIVSRLPFDLGFRPDRVGNAGEWFAGIAGFAVLAWSMGEPARTRQLEERAAAGRVNRAITHSWFRPGENRPLENIRQNILALHEALELERPAIRSPEVKQRMRTAQAALNYLRHHPDLCPRSRIDTVALIVEDCNRDLVAISNHEQISPQWGWPIAEDIGAHLDAIT